MTLSIGSRGTTEIISELRLKVDAIKAEGLYRTFLPHSRSADNPGWGRDSDGPLQIWCSNDYLGLSQHPSVIAAHIAASAAHGTGSGGSRNIAGTSVQHAELERRLARWHGKERAVVFNSGYVANFEFLSTIVKSIPDIVVFSDELNHRSLIEGLGRHRCTRVLFKHSDMRDLEAKLALYPPHVPKLIVAESLYSMDADLAPLVEICDLAEQFDALTYIDETHAVGMRGDTGAGLAEELGEQRITFLQAGFGKAVGTAGGYVTGPEAAVDLVRSISPGFIFTTALPAAVLAATIASLDRIESGRELRSRTNGLVLELKRTLRGAGVPFIDQNSHLVPVLVPGGDRIRAVADRLRLEDRIYVQPINFPSVAKNEERFRVTVTPTRTSAEIARFVSSLANAVAASDHDGLVTSTTTR